MRLLTHMNDGLVCPQTDMPQAWCDHCRALEAQALHKTANQREDYIVYTFLASEAGTCVHCGRRYVIGERIGITVAENYTCSACARGHQ